VEVLISTLGIEGTMILVGAITGPVAHNVIPEKYQFWASDKNNIARLAKKALKKLLKDYTDDGELDGDTEN
jgi:hypothetical protein